MLSFFKSQASALKLKLFRMTLHVGRGNSEMPANLAGAYVPMFVGAADYQTAVKRAVQKLQQQGYDFIDICDAKVDELDPEKWDQFVSEAWPEFILEFPDQKNVLKALKQDFIFTGPFVSYESPPE
jgi:hypothetical protein